MPKEMVYDNDARNLQFDMKVSCSDGKKQWQEHMVMKKGKMANFFEQIEKIQDELNSYL